ncbi:hypothetical protein E5163_11635 [Marinicauda algicola]|uniref:Nitrate/nitrite sensing protein domain-containing protein n=1 Tax=Marinicauda algicola TaxID=2029849 RepID=A0A4S2GYY9_9PROT|nr:nitrate- and nitrite sensing domain-containing protein [Marinicauda algicola]TGY88460.1 hypothetical protein E5163_11635 [Marinicauda algicola]
MATSSTDGTASPRFCGMAIWVVGGFAAVLAFILAFNVLNEMARADRANAAVETIALSNILLDDLARERSEAIYLTAAPAAGLADFTERMAATDATMASLGASPLFASGALTGRQRAIADRAVAAAGQLHALRAQVLSREAATIETAQEYTELTDIVIASMGDMFDALNGEPTAFSAEFAALARLQDRVSLESGIGYAGFALRGMDDPLNAVFDGAIARQRDERAAFLSVAGEARLAELDAVLALTGGPELARVRANLQQGAAPDPGLRPVWSDIMLARVSDLALERNRFARERLEALAAASHEPLRHAIVRAIAAFAALGLAFAAVRLAFMFTARRQRLLGSARAPAG